MRTSNILSQTAVAFFTALAASILFHVAFNNILRPANARRAFLASYDSAHLECGGFLCQTAVIRVPPDASQTDVDAFFDELMVGDGDADMKNFRDHLLDLDFRSIQIRDLQGSFEFPNVVFPSQSVEETDNV